MIVRKKTVIVTGAHGFIGRHVACHLSKCGWNVVGIGHGSWVSLNEQQHWGVTVWHSSDISVAALRACSVVPDAIVHCAGSGSVSFSLENPRDDFERSVNTTLNVLEYARVYIPTAMIVTLSSGGVYGEVKHLPIAEDDPLNPISPYGVHKKIVEEICNSFANHFGLSISILRLFSVYGAGLKKQLLWDACNKISRGEHTFFGTGNELRDWIHVSDVASLVEHAISHPPVTASVYNGAGGMGVSVSDILKLLYAILGETAKPSFTGITKPGDPIGYVADINKAKLIEWQPRMFWEQGITKYAQWYKKEIK